MKSVCLVGAVALALVGLAGCSKDPAPAVGSGKSGQVAQPEDSGTNPVAAKGGGMSRIPGKK